MGQSFVPNSARFRTISASCPSMFQPLLLFLIFIIPRLNAVDYFDNKLTTVCRPSERPMDLLFILDGSGSVSGNTFATQVDMLNKVVEMIDVGPKKTKIALMQYSGYTRIEFDFDTHKNKTSLDEALKHIRHISGTTKTGKALTKALHLFRHDSRTLVGSENVARVAVVVSDGHSHDDPVPAAKLLRKSGVQLMALGIGNHINMDELVQITDNNKFAFDNSSLDEFVLTFRKLAIGEVCEYAKGSRGAEIICFSDSIQVNVQMTKPFKGHLYVSGQFDDKKCVAKIEEGQRNDYISLNIPLMGCGIQKQFLLDSRGLLFETGVILKLHPDYNTKYDKVFGVRCFYPDMKYDSGNSEEVKTLLRTSGILTASNVDSIEILRIGSGDPQLSTRPVLDIHMPCIYKLETRDNDCVLEDIKVGESLVHHWECDKEVFGDTYGMLVHSCSIISVKTGQEYRIIDKNGCSLDTTVFATPIYEQPLLASVTGMAVKLADNPLMKYRCSLRFCSKNNGECAKFLPPKCDDNHSKRSKRQVVEINDQMKVIDPVVKVNSSSPPTLTSTKGTKVTPTNLKSGESVPLLTFGPTVRITALNRKRRPLNRRTVQRIERPSRVAPRRSSESVRPTLAIVRPLLRETIRNLRPLYFNPVDLADPINGRPNWIELSHGSRELRLNTQNVSIVDTRSPTNVMIDDDVSHARHKKIPDDEAAISDEETENREMASLRLQELTEGILTQIDFMQMDIQSQIVNVQDLENFRNQGQSPVNWCPRKTP